MANTISNYTYRQIYRKNALEEILKRALVAEKICEVDRRDVKRIDSPYGSEPNATISGITGQYNIVDFQTTDDYLIVDHEVKCAEHIYDFEQVLTNFDLFANRVDQQAYAVAYAIDKFVLNCLVDEAGSSYTTPPGGFTKANTRVILSNIFSKVAGYADFYKGLFLVIESTDMPGFFQDQTEVGFSFADAALKNGFLKNEMGIEVYCVRPGTFISGSLGGRVFANQNHRVFGVKNVATYAAPRGVVFEEKSVSGKTGKEVVVFGYIGFKLWTPKADLIVDITLAPAGS